MNAEQRAALVRAEIRNVYGRTHRPNGLVDQVAGIEGKRIARALDTGDQVAANQRKDRKAS